MYQRDYILRMIEMIGQFIMLVLGKMKKGDLKEAEQLLENGYRDFLKEDAAFFMHIPPEQLVDDLLGKHDYTNGHLEILSHLFYAQAEVFAASERTDESREFYRKSFILLEYVIKESASFSLEQHQRMAELKEKINND